VLQAEQPLDSSTGSIGNRVGVVEAVEPGAFRRK
jgi:hypothetical protein